MFTLKRNIQNIRNVLEIQVFKHGVVFLSHINEDCILVSKNANNDDLWNIKLKIEPYELSQNKDNIYAFYPNGLLKIDVIKGEIIDNILIKGSFSSPFKEGYLVYAINEITNSYTPTYLKDGRTSWQLNKPLNMVNFKNNEYVIGFSEYDEWGQSKKNSLAIYEPDKSLDSPLWQFNLSDIGRWYNEFDKKWEEGQVWNFVGVVDGILWVDVMAHTLLGIDVQTGELRHHLKETIIMNAFPENYPTNIPYWGFSTYDKNLNKIWGIEGYSYWEVDLNETSPHIKIWYLGEELQKLGAAMSNLPMCGISATHVFFGVGSIGKTPQVCALNRITLKIDWRYDFSKEAENTEIAFSPTKVEVTENHLFVLDSEGTLHIFEKQETA